MYYIKSINEVKRFLTADFIGKKIKDKFIKFQFIT